MQRIVILGAGESGVGAAILAQKKGFDVFVSDLGSIQDKYKTQLANEQIAWEEGQHSTEKVLKASEVIKSPGIPDKAPIILELKAKGIPVVSEIEFAGRYTSAKIIAITGSNGKTTTASLLYFMLKKAGLNVGLAGNIGKSFALQVARSKYDYYVLELSSFQLDGMYDFKADIGILTNITPDHLDRYNNDFQCYVKSKFRLVQNMTPQDVLICNADDETIEQNLRNLTVEQQTYVCKFSYHNQTVAAHTNQGTFCVKLNDTVFEMKVDNLALQGRHNVYNSMAAAMTGILMGLSKEQIRDGLQSFSAVEHRLEEVLTIRGIRFINDSKATNINSTWFALECMTQPTVLILGGVDKGNDYEVLKALVYEKVKAIVCLGTDNSKIVAAFGKITQVLETQSMQEAVRSAYYLASTNQTVLLSPACASFDLFKSYEDRGLQFKDEVKKL